MTLDVERSTELRAALEAGQHDTVIARLTSPPPTSAWGWRLLGMAYLWSGRLTEAELPLLRASALGDAEAEVEYGNLLRMQGKFAQAVAHFGAISPRLSGELALRAERWWGTAQFQAGQTGPGLERCERAWRGYMALGDDDRIGRVTQTLAQMVLKVGDLPRAQALYEEALRLLPQGTLARLTALTNLANVQILTGDFTAGRATLERAWEALSRTDTVARRAYLLSVEAELCRLTGDGVGWRRTLKELRAEVEGGRDFELRLWTATGLADAYSLGGEYARALEALLDLAPDPAHPAVSLMRGVLSRRQQHFPQAVASLERALSTPGLNEQDRVRALLHLAHAHAGAGSEARALAVLREAVGALIRAQGRMLYRPDLQELGDLVQRALLDPDLAPDMGLVLDKLALTGGAAPGPRTDVLHLRVFTLGRAAVERAGVEVHLSLEGAVLTLAYLALNPGRTRRELEAAIYPDRDPKTAGDYFRAVFRELRVRLGQGVLLMEGGARQPRYRLGPDVHVDLDVSELRAALAAGDLAGALALYRGPFLPGLRMDSEWADELREELRLSLAMEVRSRLDRAREAGDPRRALLLANEFLRIEPYDLDVLEARVEIAREAASPQELARYVVELQRMRL